MKILFLDIDGVVNSATSIRRNRRLIDPHLAFIVRRIAIAIPDLKVVLSSSWRCLGDGREIVEKKIIRCFDVTPILHDLDLSRGHEIQAWLSAHPEVERYAILDDDNDMLEHQMVNFFQTSRRTGITPKVADRIIAHFTQVALHSTILCDIVRREGC